MSNKELFDDFRTNVKKFSNVNETSEFFGVSTHTIRKWEIVNSNVPNYAIVIINRYKENQKLRKKIDSLNFDNMSIKQSIHNFINSRDKLLDILS